MKARLAALFLSCAFMSGCANFIKDADAVIWDRVEGTDKAALDDLRPEGAIVNAKIRFICQKRQFAVTNIYETPYVGSAEFYEVPVGLICVVPSFLWYVVSELVTLGAVEKDVAAGPLYWSVAGLWPFINVEGGMFTERYRIREKKGSRRPQEGSKPEPYDAVLPPEGGQIKVRFAGGPWVDVDVGDELLMQLNLVEIAHSIPSKSAQKLEVEVTLLWNPEAEPVTKTVVFYINRDLSEKLYSLRSASHIIVTTTDPAKFNAALAKVEEAGFSREAAMLRDKFRAKLVVPKPE